jgi:GTPase Era involved in 16S rRNA processing
MEQWVTDTFFLNFPSLNKKAEDKKNELRDRQARDYQEYLSNLPAFSSKRKFEPKLYHADEVHTNSSGAEIYVHDDSATNNVNSPLFKRAVDVNLNQPEIRKDSPRHRQLENLKHVDLPAILHSNKVDKVNRQHVQEEAQKKMDYQQDLIKQIEEKRREVESLREKEKREEEMLTR